MTVSLSDRDAAGTAYATALANWLTALVDLAAKERILDKQISGGLNGIPGTIDLHALTHQKYVTLATLTSGLRIEDQIQARVHALGTV